MRRRVDRAVRRGVLVVVPGLKFPWCKKSDRRQRALSGLSQEGPGVSPASDEEGVNCVVKSTV